MGSAMKTNRFLVFSFDHYYPSGGWGDFTGSSDTIEGAREIEDDQKSEYDYTEIVDLEKMETV